MSNPNEKKDPKLHHVTSVDGLPEGVSLDDLVAFFHDKMKPWHDTPGDVAKALDYAFGRVPGRQGFAVLATIDGTLIGGTVFLDTGMGGYVPRNLLLFVAVLPELRGRGYGKVIIDEALRHCEGDVKLHVEYENPAQHLYERVGFVSKYKEMRLIRD